MKRLVAAAALAAIALAAAALAAAGQAHAPTTVRSSALLFDGKIRCSVSIATPAHVGRPLRVRVRLHNISQQPVKITQHPHDTWLVIRGSDGKTFDTRMSLGYTNGGPRSRPRTIPAGATVSARSSLDALVRWSGPLRITPGCGGRMPAAVGPTGSGQSEHVWRTLPPVHVRVSRTAAPVSSQAALAAVVAASGHLLRNCRPSVPGVPVDGLLNAPHGAAPPMRARCSVHVIRERGFYLAQELIVTPPSLKVYLRRAYGRFAWPPAHGNWEAIAWQFVVTRDRVVTVAVLERRGEKFVKRRSAPDWLWTPSGPSAAGSESCGRSGASWGGDGPDVVWVSACRR